MPRPPLRPSEHVKGVKLNLHPSTWEALRKLAYVQRTTLSEQARRAVDVYLATQRPKGRKATR